MMLFLLSARNITGRKCTIDTLKSFYKQTHVSGLRLNNTLSFRQHGTLDTTSDTTICCPQHPLLFHRRSLHTTSAKNKDDDKVRKLNIVHRGPFKYLSLKVKLFLLKSYFDQKFDEEAFLIGAKQAVFYVAGNIADGKIEDLRDVLTSKGVRSCRDALDDYHGNPDLLKVKEEDEMDIKIDDVGFDYGFDYGKGEKFVNVLVLFVLPGKVDDWEIPGKEYKKIKENVKNMKEDFQFDIMRLLPRKIRYSFRRNYTPSGGSSDWLIDYVKYI